MNADEARLITDQQIEYRYLDMDREVLYEDRKGEAIEQCV